MLRRGLLRHPIFLLTLVALPWITAATATPAANPATDPATLFAGMRAASGGDRWNQVAEIDYEATLSQGGQQGTLRMYLDTRSGRYASLSDLDVASGSEGFDGAHSWMRDEKGLVSVRDAPQARRDAATDAYLARNGWFASPARDPATLRYLGERQEHGHRFQRVSVTPAHGVAIEAWIDADTHLLDRIRRRDGNGRINTTEYSDYRTVDGLRLPFAQRTGNGDSQYDSTLRVRHYDVLARAVDAHFARPDSLIRDARIIGGAATAQVPFERYDGLILVKVSIDGGAPLPFILDSGGLNLLTPEAARKLGIRGKGHQSVQGVGENAQSLQVADVGAYRLGDVQLDRQRFLIVELPLLLTDRGDRPAIAGLIGYELLRRFTTRIDYDRRQLTFSAAGGLRHASGEDMLALDFSDRTPQVHARVNGADGVFMLDTGDSGDLTLFAPFAKAHAITLDGKVSKSQSGGVGGVIDNQRGHVDSFAVASFALRHPPVTLSAPSSGVFASDVLAGNIGQGILSRFTVTLDYDSQRMQLQPGTDWTRPFEDAPSMGFGLNRIDHDTYQVVAVESGSVAQADGLTKGDNVVALDNVPASRLGLDDLRAAMRRGAHDGLVVTVLRDGKRRDIHIAAVKPAAPQVRVESRAMQPLR